MGRRELPSVVIEVARALGVPQASLNLLPGAAGQTWSSGKHVLRVRPTAALKVEMAAWAAASSVVPTPQLIDFAELEAVSAALVRPLPGTPAGDLGSVTPDRDELAEVYQALDDFDKQAPVSHVAEGHGGPQ
jgi:hypothetical protein